MITLRYILLNEISSTLREDITSAIQTKWTFLEADKIAGSCERVQILILKIVPFAVKKWTLEIALITLTLIYEKVVMN